MAWNWVNLGFPDWVNGGRANRVPSSWLSYLSFQLPGRKLSLSRDELSRTWKRANYSHYQSFLLTSLLRLSLFTLGYPHFKKEGKKEKKKAPVTSAQFNLVLILVIIHLTTKCNVVPW
jgi:hypothetical protein